MNWTTFRSGVIDSYAQGATTEMGYACVAAYVKSLIVREVDGDLLLSKSYMTTYEKLKAQIAAVGVPVFATTRPEVLVRITVDADRVAISDFIDKAIAEAIADINKMITVFDKYLVDFAIDAQRHVKCFTQNQQTTYKKADISQDGCVSVLTPPAGNITEVLFERYAPALTTGNTYAVGDQVSNNGRIYTVAVGGVMGAIGSGLQSTDGKQETLGSLTFTFAFYQGLERVQPVAWSDRETMGKYKILSYSLNPWADTLLVYPILDSTSFKFVVYWNGIKKTFSGGDDVTFDESCFSPAAEYIRGMIQKNMLGEERAAASSIQLYQTGLRRLWLDCQSRTNSD